MDQEMEIINVILSVLGLVVPGAMAFGFAVWMLNIQKKKNAAVEKAEQEKLEAERKKIETEVWQMVNNELRDEIDRYKGERTLLIQKVDELTRKVEFFETEIRESERLHDEQLQKERRQFAIKEQGYLAAINGLNDKVDELQKVVTGTAKQVNKVEKDTDKLKMETRLLQKQTGQLPEQKKDE